MRMGRDWQCSCRWRRVFLCFPICPVQILQFQATDAQSSSAIDPNEWTGPLGQHPMSQAKQLNRCRGTGERERNTRAAKEKKSLDWFEGLLFGCTRERNDRRSKGGNSGMCIALSPARSVEFVKQVDDHNRTAQCIQTRDPIVIFVLFLRCYKLNLREGRR